MKKFLTILLSCCLSFCVASSFCGVFADESRNGEFEIIQENTDGIKLTRINNVFSLNAKKTRSINKNQLEQFAKEHPVGFDVGLAKSSKYIVYQEQKINALTGEMYSGSTTDQDGYLTMYTTAYHKGYSKSGNARYLVKGEIVFHKVFKTRNQDQFIMNHSTTGVFDSTGTEEGMMSYHASLHNHSAFRPPLDKEEDVNTPLTPDYTNSYGVCFKLKWPRDEIQNNNSSGAIKVDIRYVYTNWKLSGSYYVIATNDTNVAINYIQNKDILGNNLSISFGAYGVSAGLNIEGKRQEFNARPILIYNI